MTLEITPTIATTVGIVIFLIILFVFLTIGHYKEIAKIREKDYENSDKRNDDLIKKISDKERDKEFRNMIIASLGNTLITLSDDTEEINLLEVISDTISDLRSDEEEILKWRNK